MVDNIVLVYDNIVNNKKNMNDLELILKYKMNDIEAKSYKLCLMYEELCLKEFPNERHIKLSKKSDPRKTTIFKYCYKLLKETKGIFEEKDYYLYILAQFQVLKLIKEGNIHALIEPQILVGDKAWKRWKIWKKIYDKKMNSLNTSQDLGIVSSESKLKIQLKNTHKFLKKNNCLTEVEIKDKITDLLRWIKTGQVSPYYVILSPNLSKIKVDLDVALYKPSITPSIEEFFKKEFSDEI